MKRKLKDVNGLTSPFYSGTSCLNFRRVSKYSTLFLHLNRAKERVREKGRLLAKQKATASLLRQAQHISRSYKVWMFLLAVEVTCYALVKSS